MNVTVTTTLASAILRLKSGWWIAKVKRHSYSDTHYYLMGNGTNVDTTETVVDQLVKLKLVDGQPNDRCRRYFRGTKRIYVANDRCRAFKLPPEEFWIKDEVL